MNSAEISKKLNEHLRSQHDAIGLILLNSLLTALVEETAERTERIQKVTKKLEEQFGGEV